MPFGSPDITGSLTVREGKDSAGEERHKMNYISKRFHSSFFAIELLHEKR